MKKLHVLLIAALAACLAFAIAGCSSGASSDEAAAPEASAEEMVLLNDGVLTVGTSPDYAPFEYLENGEYVGFDMEMAKALGEKMGLEVQFVTIQFDGIIPAVAAGGQCDVGISGFSYDPERAEQIDFTDAYYVDDQAIVVMNDSGITEDNAAESINQADIVIAAQSGSTGESYAKENFPNATVTPYGNATDCFAAMQAGQADAVAINYAVADEMVSTSYTDASIVIADATGEEYMMVVSKDNPALTAALNEALAELQADGTIDALAAKYFG